MDGYPWLKGLHVAAVVAFVGGTLATTIVLSTVPANRDLSAEQRKAVNTIRRWDAGMTTPAMLLVWAFGLALALAGDWFKSGWLPAKLVFVLLLSAMHGLQSGSLRRLAGGQVQTRSPRLGVFFIISCAGVIVILAAVKPF